MKTDRELLELAAKAAGIKGEWTDAYLGCYYDQRNGEAGLITDVGSKECPWNPIEYTGDALELGSAMHLHILHNDPEDPVLWVSAVLNKRGIHGVVEFEDESQRASSICRAIVLAAAEIQLAKERASAAA